MSEQCDYHYYFFGDAPYPAFVCGLEKGHEGEHKDALKIIAEELKAKYEKQEQPTGFHGR